MNKMDVAILYEDDQIVVINKPAGIMVHGDGRTTEQTVADWFVLHYPESVNVGEEAIETKEGSLITRPGIVHRLDKETSGALVLCKTDEAHVYIKKQFQDREVSKTYTALVYGIMKEDSYYVNAAIGRAKTFAKWTAIPKAMRGKEREAQTGIIIKQRFEKHTLVEAQPKTGRTHQIRVHLQYLNYPIIADRIYAGKRYDANDPATTLGFTRQALHASSITLMLPSEKEITIESPLPQDFVDAIKKIS